MGIEIDVVNGDAGWPAAEALFDVVWPLHVLEKLPWGNVMFAEADLRVLLRNEAGDLVCHVGIYRRVVTCNGRSMNAGGIGGVATHDECRRQGYASMALAAALRTMQDEGSIDFAMLFCEPRLAPFYRERGWKWFDGKIYAEQPEGRILFTAIGPYVHDVRWRAPSSGVIDLNGLPW